MTRTCKTALVALGAIFLASLAAQPPALAETIAKTESMVLKVGTPAPVFTLKTLKGEEYRLGDHLGKKPILMFFWSIFCGPCREEMPVLQKAYEAAGKEKLEFVGVNIDGKVTKAIEKFTGESGYSFVTVMDELNGMTLKVSDPYGVVATPIVYIIDKAGKVSFVGVGKAEGEALQEALNKVMN